ncbi:hypothetical protein [Massilia sp. DD77]|uniref:hypothetical protein n=1 Tax=Massilia sp. DD77 TaxID=3109349 RepID=UPI003FA5F49A
MANLNKIAALAAALPLALPSSAQAEGKIRIAEQFGHVPRSLAVLPCGFLPGVL